MTVSEVLALVLAAVLLVFLWSYVGWLAVAAVVAAVVLLVAFT